jgi:hypothetical protein
VYDLTQDGERRVVALQRFCSCDNELVTQQRDSLFADFENLLKLVLNPSQKILNFCMQMLGCKVALEQDLSIGTIFRRKN